MCGINYKFLEELRIALKCGSSAVVSEKLIAKEIKETGKQKLELIECRVRVSAASFSVIQITLDSFPSLDSEVYFLAFI